MNYLKRISTATAQVIELSKKRFNFENINYLPRWLILLFDIVICFVALFITKYILFSVSGKSNSLDFLYLELSDLVILVTNILFFLVLRTYAGLIRHSTFIDAVKFFLASSATFIVLLISNFSLIYFKNIQFTTSAKLVIYFSVSFSILFLFRVLVKQLYEAFFNNSNAEVESALIYGDGDNAIAVANALKSERPLRFKIKGFVNNNQKNNTKQILGLPILHTKKSIAVLMKANGASSLILAEKNLTREKRLKLVDECLDQNFKTFRAPLVSNLKEDEKASNQIKNIQIEDLLERDPIQLDYKLIAKELFHKTVIITGGAGSIGSEILRQIGNYDVNKVIVIDQAETPLYQIQNEIEQKYPHLDFEPILADVTNYDKLDRIFNFYKPDIIYHAAAYKHVPLIEKNPSEAIFVNVKGTKNLADLSLKYDVEKFVMVSTDKAVNPSNVMGASKRIAEMYVQSLHYFSKQSGNLKTNFITTRFGNVLGSNGSVVPLFRKQISSGGPLTITHPDIIRYFMTIPEACQLVLEAAAMGNGGEIYIFDMGKPVKIIDLAIKIIKLSGFVPYEDIDIKIIGLRPGEKLYEELLNDKTTTLPTYHEKIMIAKVDGIGYNKLSEEISVLLDYAEQTDNHKTVIQMKVIVPEFKSMNSIFEKLDNNLNQSLQENIK